MVRRALNPDLLGAPARPVARRQTSRVPHPEPCPALGIPRRHSALGTRHAARGTRHGTWGPRHRSRSRTQGTGHEHEHEHEHDGPMSPKGRG
ncbi:hypothetical protein CIK72_16185 [Brachybacterium alimentarium]|nr:hypothetical protein CIK73_00850 [Brachybacterium alimentarium]RCS75904.1 hypothetical protein CIK72_16185 [Brachybacterium alimentarium]